MNTTIRKIAVVGAGTMGVAIAACGARAGLDVILMSRREGDVNGATYAAEAVQNIVKKGEMRGTCPDRILNGVKPAGMESDASMLKDCDLVIEAVSEDLKTKRSVMEFIFSNCGENTIVGSNTSGISISYMAAPFPSEWRRRFMGIHFFNPVRYTDLVELIPHPETKQDIINAVSALINDRFGKSPIVCKDDPGFVANRIGSMTLTTAINAVSDFGYTFTKADALTGELMFRPKQGAFRLLDMVGIDICVHTAEYMSTAAIPEFEKPFRNKPEILFDLYERGFLGNKTGSGFYKKEKTASGTKRYMWDYNNKKYVPAKKEKIESIESLDKKARFETLLFGDIPESDFFRRVLLEPLWLSMMLCDNISYDFRDIDTAMRSGYNWTKGPFEICDAIGADKVFDLMKKQNLDPPEWVENKIKDDGAFYTRNAKKNVFISVNDEDNTVIMENDDAVLLDIGDKVACFSLKTKANAYTTPAAQLLLEASHEVEKSGAFKAMIVSNQGANFGSGANLIQVAGAIESNRFDMLEAGLKALQDGNMAIKYLKKPVVVAAQGQALGGSAEMMLHAGRVIAHRELYAGLVETGMGLVPSCGGCAELLFRATEGLEYGQMTDIIATLDKIVLPIARASYSMSAEEAFANGYLRRGDIIVPKFASLMECAKKQAIFLADCGWLPPVRGTVTAAGENGYTHLMATVNVMLKGRFMTEYDGVIVEKLARIFTGGDALAGEKITEDDVLALERKSFLELCRNEKTLERIKGILATGKPVRN